MYGLIQVAGVIDQSEADLIIEEGADWLGFALRLPAKNEDLSEADAAAIVKAIQPDNKGVIITYLTDADEIAAFCAEMGVGAIQLHGDVTPGELRRLRTLAPDLYVLKSLVVKSDNIDELREIVDTSAEWVDMFITDSFNPATGAKGATGLTHDWSVSAELVRISPKPLMMAGGLTPENVGAAIEAVRPAAVDSHTGLEDPTTRRKDRQKVRTFVQEARAAFARVAAEDGIHLLPQTNRLRALHSIVRDHQAKREDFVPAANRIIRGGVHRTLVRPDGRGVGHPLRGRRLPAARPGVSRRAPALHDRALGRQGDRHPGPPRRAPGRAGPGGHRDRPGRGRP
ncbi:N-(5'-phosphoribosyl)anthranilate isomerase [Streptomyces microflavus]